MQNDNPSLRDVIARRLEIRGELQQIESQKRKLAAEDQDLAVAERVLSNLTLPAARNTEYGELIGVADALMPPPPPPPPWVNPPPPPPPLPPPPPASPAGMTQEEVVHFIMSVTPDPWMTSNHIQDEARKCGKDIPMSSLSPMLTNLKNKGIVERDGLKVALSSRVKNKAAVE